jgi:hypothetical protein
VPTQFVAPGITRFDIGGRHGFMVRICRKGKKYSKYFSDSTYGGKLRAKKAAQACYDAFVMKMGPAVTSLQNRFTSRNTSGVVGIHKAKSFSPRWPNSESWGYCASWTNEDGSRGKINFAWTKYGKNNAMELAKLARKHRSTDREKIVALFERRKSRAKAAVKPKANVKKAKKRQ